MKHCTLYVYFEFGEKLGWVKEIEIKCTLYTPSLTSRLSIADMVSFMIFYRVCVTLLLLYVGIRSLTLSSPLFTLGYDCNLFCAGYVYTNSSTKSLSEWHIHDCMCRGGFKGVDRRGIPRPLSCPPLYKILNVPLLCIVTGQYVKVNVYSLLMA